MKRNIATTKAARRAKTAPMIAARKIAESKAAELAARQAAPFNPLSQSAMRDLYHTVARVRIVKQ